MDGQGDRFSGTRRKMDGQGDRFSGTRRKMDGEGDRFSGLPDAVLHHTLSFLPAEDAVRTSILSSRCRDLWKSCSHLTFEKRDAPWDYHFVRLVNGVLFVPGGSDIKSFRLLGINDSDFFHLPDWILGAIRRKVCEIEIQVSAGTENPLGLPDGLFNCQTLTTLKLSLQQVPGVPSYLPLQWPGSINLPNLKDLRLSQISLGDLEAASRFVSSCPSLSRLEISHCRFNVSGCFVINSPKLKFLTMQTLARPVMHNCIIRVYAPHLEYLLCDDVVRKDYSFVEELAHLRRANIGGEVGLRFRKILPFEDWHIDEDKREKIFQRVTSTLKAVRSAEDLTLNPWTLLIAFESRVAQEGLFLRFPNLKHLKLQTRFSQDCAISIMHLLKTSPKIETLNIEIIENTFSWDPLILDENKSTAMHVGEWWQSELSSHCMFHHLKDVKISGIVGCLTEIKLVEVVLKKATILRRMVLCSSAASPIGKKGLIDLSQMLMDVPRASSNVTLVLV